MRLKNYMLTVSDMDKALAFYQEVLGLEVEMDFGANKVLTGGLVLQTLETWREFIETDEISFGSNSAEIYFEEDEFDAFTERLEGLEIACVHPVKEHAWGQRVARLYDPDRHIVEVGETMNSVCRRFMNSGMTVEETARRMDVPPEYVWACM